MVNLDTSIEDENWIQVRIRNELSAGCKNGFNIENEKLPVFVPNIELIFFLLDIRRITKVYKYSFDSPVIDIVEKISSESVQENLLRELSQQIIAKIETIVGGKFFVDNNLAMIFTKQSYVQNSNVISANNMAEGFRT